MRHGNAALDVELVAGNWVNRDQINFCLSVTFYVRDCGPAFYVPYVCLNNLFCRFHVAPGAASYLPNASISSVHSRFERPLDSCVTFSPASSFFTTASPLAERCAPPSRYCRNASAVIGTHFSSVSIIASA